MMCSRSIVATSLIASILIVISALNVSPLVSEARNVSAILRTVRLSSLSAEPACDDGRLVDEDAAEPGTEVESHGIVFEFLPSSYETGARSLTVVLTNRDGEPVTGAIVFATIRMPAMDHGRSAYPARETEAGRYRMDDVSLGMTGEWLVTFEVIRQARAPAVATFRVVVDAR